MVLAFIFSRWAMINGEGKQPGKLLRVLRVKKKESGNENIFGKV